MTDGQRQPRAFVIDPPKPHEIKTEARRKPRAITGIQFETEGGGDQPVVAPARLPVSRQFRWGMVLGGALFSLIVMWAGLSISQLIEDFFSRSPALGWLTAGLAGLAALAALAITLRELLALIRLRKIESIQADAAHTLNTDDPESGKRVIAELRSLYGNRPEQQWGLTALAEHDSDIMDPRDRLRLAERYLIIPRDEDAHRIIARAARRVTLLTTVTPAAALDILFVAAQNLRMMRELATLYGGRPSTLATLRLARMVVSHLAVTGGLALSDNLLQHVVGKGLLGRLSARFGEGAVNGILTARIGLAARDVCRPIPQETSAKETLGSLLRELVATDGAKTPE